MAGAYVNSVWQKSWDLQTNNKLHSVQPVIGKYKYGKLTRRDEVVIHRLRVGHSHLTHSYLLKKELPPVCDGCGTSLTVEHMIIGCSKYTSQRRKFFDNCCSVEDLFSSFNSNVIIEFIKEIGIYRKL